MTDDCYCIDCEFLDLRDQITTLEERLLEVERERDEAVRVAQVATPRAFILETERDEARKKTEDTMARLVSLVVEHDKALARIQELLNQGSRDGRDALDMD